CCQQRDESSSCGSGWRRCCGARGVIRRLSLSLSKNAQRQSKKSTGGGPSVRASGARNSRGTWRPVCCFVLVAECGFLSFRACPFCFVTQPRSITKSPLHGGQKLVVSQRAIEFRMVSRSLVKNL